ncbi:MAG: hypothetical protein EOM67_06065 [Spirochaetia bacterium]|nr:hypothetical protein [Spirochaetia bacterium]
MKKLCIILIVVLLSSTLAVSARANERLAIGGQLGFLATGVVVDIPLGPIAIQGGLNYPLGIKYIGEASGEDTGDLDSFLDAFFVVSADITYPISMGENFDLKVGVSTLGFTDFQAGILGVAGITVKGEYWVPNKNYGLFVNLNSPLIIYGVAEGEFFQESNAYLPLIGLVTSTAGMLWRL